MTDPLQQKLKDIGLKMLLAAGEEEDRLVLLAMVGALLSAAQLMPQCRAFIRETLRDTLMVIEALGDATGDEAAAIVQQFAAAMQAAEGQPRH